MSKYPKDYTYNSRIPIHANLHAMPERHQDLLTTDPHFCMIPWIHMHAFPDGRAYPCCMGEYNMPIGNLKEQTMKQVWNSEGMREMRVNMLKGKPSKECGRCYEQEKAGFVSMRHSTSQNFGQHIGLVDNTLEDGTVEDFKLRYYDIRFSNVCNFRCRSCGSIFSSNWYNDEVKLYGDRKHPRIMYAGKTEEDMWEQMQEHIPHLDQIYFAGGEPLIMEEHYRLLNELVKREMFHVRLIYNTNFSKLAYKDQDVLELWKKFDVVSVGASLDASGARGEYIRKGQDWAETVENRKRMLEICPKVDFYVSATVSIYNAMHIADFHREWVELGLIKPQDFNINILQSPNWFRIDCLPQDIKDQIRVKIEEHIQWLEPLDKLTRATSGYRGMLSFMDAQIVDPHWLTSFFDRTVELDNLRNEEFFATFPELKDLRKHAPTP
jgi:radical SAM protein with 4Fe4S-binding SPASM domain